MVNVADGRPKTRYILAVDDSKNSLGEVVKAISVELGAGKVQVVSREDALLNKDLTVSYDDPHSTPSGETLQRGTHVSMTDGVCLPAAM